MPRNMKKAALPNRRDWACVVVLCIASWFVGGCESVGELLADPVFWAAVMSESMEHQREVGGGGEYYGSGDYGPVYYDPGYGDGPAVMQSGYQWSGESGMTHGTIGPTPETSVYSVDGEVLTLP